jgi:NAD(P)-dependent dehydrogenase (short-subunit alcohol dehydrogenase family)
MGTAAVTGSASGIGAAIKKRLEANGDRVIGVDLRGADIEADLSNPDGRKRAVAGVLDACGGKLDRLVACAGLGAHLDDFALIASVNYFGAVATLDGLKDALAGRDGAAAVAICSNSARFGPFDDHPFVLACLDGDEKLARELIAKENGFMAYGGSKHALSRAVRRRAVEWGAAGVRLNGIAPGSTQTAMIDALKDHPVFKKGHESLVMPLGRNAEPEEIANVVNFLLSPEASYVHGAIWYADGGNEAATLPDRF